MMKRRLSLILALAMIVVWSPEPRADIARPGVAKSNVLNTLDFGAKEEIEVPIVMDAKGAVALQLDLEYEADLLEVRGGKIAFAAEAAGKMLTVRHVKGGLARVVIFGYNLEPLPQGELATVRFHAYAPAKESAVRAVDRRAVGADGGVLPTVIRGGRIVVTPDNVAGQEVSHDAR